MKASIGERLRQGDPVTREGDLPEADVRAMRRAILGAAPETPPAAWSPGPLWVGGMIAAALFLSTFIGPRLEQANEGSSSSSTSIVGSQSTEQRQLQFETPGGTRVVWVLNSGLDL